MTTLSTEIFELEQKALAGETDAQYYFGLRLLKDIENKDKTFSIDTKDKHDKFFTALMWINKSAIKGYDRAISMFQHLVSLTEIENNDMIQLCLSHMYFTQALKTKDNYNNLREKSIDYAKLDLAIDWLLKSADQNCVEAQITLGMSIIENKINSFFPIPGFLTDMIQDESLHSMRWTSIPADYIQKIKLKALEHLNKAALQNNIFAQYWMGRIHYDKHEMDSSNYNAALPWFQKSFEGGYLYAGLYLSEMYAKGLGCDSNHEQSVEIIQGIIYWLKNETHSFSEAVTQRCKTLSSNFLIDIAIKQYEAVKYQPETNKAELSAWKLLDILADCNCLDAAAQRAHCYARGIYVEQNIDKAATLGDIDSQLQLAERYIHGIGVEKNVLTALAWYEKAADQGNAEARYQAAYWHMQNRSTRSETEDGEAVERLFHAVIQEHPLATEWFMDSCLKFVFPYIHASKNSEQGYRFAFDWLTQKAQEYHENGTHDDYMIHYGLGILYTFGKGIKKNHELAKNHLRKSIDLLPSDHNSFNFCDLVWAVGATCLSIIYNTTKIAIDEKEFFNIIETDYWVFICLGCVFSSVKKDTDIEIKKILPFLEFNYHISHSNYDLAEQVLKKDFSIHLDRDLPLENSFKSMGLLALKEIKSLEKAHQALREKEKEMLSFFTHTMRNALATAPESLRQAISLLGNEVYEKDINHYKAINKIASLFSTLSLTDCLIDTFKQSISEPEEFRQAWNQDQTGEATPEWVIGSALRQSLNRMFFLNDPTVLERLIGQTGTPAIKQARKSFIDEVLPLNLNDEDISHFFTWVNQHVACLDITIQKADRFHFGAHKTRFSLLFAITSELILNALKYWNGQGKLQIIWQPCETGDFEFMVSNPCNAEVSSPLASTHKGLAFVKRLMELLGYQDDCQFGVEKGIYVATVRLPQNLMEVSA